MNRSRILGGACLAAVLAGGVSGCGYTTDTQYRKGVKTIAVPVFHRAAGEYRRDIEIRLTEAVKKRIEAETPYKVVDESRADTLLTGTLRSVRLRPLSFDTRTGRAREVQALLRVDFTWKDLRGPGKILVERKDFRAAADFIPPDPFAEDLFLGSEDAINKVAQRIVEQLTEPW